MSRIIKKDCKHYEKCIWAKKQDFCKKNCQDYEKEKSDNAPEADRNAVLNDVQAALKDLEDYIRGDTLEITVSGNDGFDGQEIIRDPESRDVVMQNIGIIFQKLNERLK